MPGDRRTPVVAGDDSGFLSKGVEEADHVTDEMHKRILIDGLRLVGLAVSAHVRGDDVEAFGGERLDLVTPGIP